VPYSGGTWKLAAANTSAVQRFFPVPTDVVGESRILYKRQREIFKLEQYHAMFYNPVGSNGGLEKIA
jgi:hypothetical protein